MILDDLVNASRRLSDSLTKLDSTDKSDIEAYAYARDAAIMRFVMTHELAFKTIRRFLKDEARQSLTYTRQVYKAAAKAGLIDNLEQWECYLDARNALVHTYAESTAEGLVADAQQFRIDVESVLQKMKDVLEG